MLESIYRAAGMRHVGLFTSPHLVAFGERIQVNREPIPQKDIVRLVEKLRVLLECFSGGSHPTFFEVVTMMALCYFAERDCDLVIWETGLGGRLDATNIVTPVASVITNIQFDHQEHLGHTLEEIAAEKAGIIKIGVPVITGAAPAAGLEVIDSKARECQAPLRVIDPAASEPEVLRGLELPLRGDHQRINAGVALAVVEQLQAKLPVTREAMAEGLRLVNWPGRLQLVSPRPGRTVLLDGAHNAAGAEALAHELAAHFPGVEPTVIFGVLEDKDWQAMAHSIAARARWIHLVPVKSQRALNPARLVSACREVNAKAPVNVSESLAWALHQSANDPFVLITGSLYLVGEAMELLGLSTAAGGERALNDWTTGPKAPGR
jgi:dihydrofolate synthase/folylpolyglutamate synthase